MFYTQLFTSKWGSLAKIWLSAHWERKLTKSHVYECNLETTVRDIISPKVKMGLRTSGHLLFGVVRIYSRKAKYLLADCSEALLRINVAFRPDQTDLPQEELEATARAINLQENFDAFEAELPPHSSSDLDLVDHFSLNQGRREDITLMEVDVGNESQSLQNQLLDLSFQSFTQERDSFGDEDKGYSILDFLTTPCDPAELRDVFWDPPRNGHSEPSRPDPPADADSREPEGGAAAALPVNVEEAFTLEPVPFTPSSQGRRRPKRKRHLVVDQAKELSNELIREQISDYSDLVAPLDLAPPTVQLMQWKESGGVDKLFALPCVGGLAPQISELFMKNIFHLKHFTVHEEVEEFRLNETAAAAAAAAAGDDMNSSIVDNVTALDSSHVSHNGSTLLLLLESEEIRSSPFEKENESELTCPELPSEDSMFVHPSSVEQESHVTSLNSQFTMDSEELRVTRRAQGLLKTLQLHRDASFSLSVLCQSSTRLQAANTFFSLLVLKKQGFLQLHQSAPYRDIVATPGPHFSQ